MGVRVALPATGVMDFVEVTERTPCAILVLDMFKNVIVKCRATAEQDGNRRCDMCEDRFSPAQPTSISGVN